MNFDGSYLGSYPIEVILSYEQIDKMNAYVKIITETGINHCLLRKQGKYKGYFNIIDEFKDLFNITKIGTHTISLDHKLTKTGFVKGKTTYIIMRAEYDDFTRSYKTYYTINSPWKPKLRTQIMPWHIKLSREIQRLLVFRKMVMVRKTKGENILLRIAGNTMIPFSCDEFSTTLFDKNKYLSMSWLKNESWVTPKAESLVIQDFLKLMPLLELQDKMEEIVARINPDYGILVDFVMEKLSQELER